ncbi:hypothetical protein LTR85_008713 [Meristemomyces frigidus]|nr:hypothetical protein LTR85_008713 [Meristemomyces frigidus]
MEGDSNSLRRRHPLGTTASPGTGGPRANDAVVTNANEFTSAENSVRRGQDPIYNTEALLELLKANPADHDSPEDEIYLASQRYDGHTVLPFLERAFKHLGISSPASQIAFSAHDPVICARTVSDSQRGATALDRTASLIRLIKASIASQTSRDRKLWTAFTEHENTILPFLARAFQYLGISNAASDVAFRPHRPVPCTDALCALDTTYSHSCLNSNVMDLLHDVVQPANARDHVFTWADYAVLGGYLKGMGCSEEDSGMFVGHLEALHGVLRRREPLEWAALKPTSPAGGFLDWLMEGVARSLGLG